LARTIAAFFVLCSVALMSGFLTANLLTYTIDTTAKIVAGAPAQTFDPKPRFVPRQLAVAKSDVLNIAKSVPAVPVSLKAEAATAPVFTVVAESLRVRSGPSKTSPQVMGLKGGTKVTVTTSENGWLLVMTADGRSGWAHSKFLRPLVPDQVAEAR
jgi:uncharacterized protein YgiM (DUF1202 family)